MSKKILYFALALLLLSSTAILRAKPTVTLATDSTDDVEKIYWAGLTYDYDKGNFKDEIDIVSLEIETLGNSNISLTITLQDTPVIDGYHLYWVSINFEGEGDVGDSAGAWFWVGGYEGTEAESAWWIWGNMSDIETLGTGSNMPSIESVSHSMSWQTNASYWPDLANSNNWDINVWSWTSDGLAYSQALTSGTSYWDYYPDDESNWQGTSDNSTTTTTTDDNDGENGESTPGFELLFPIISLPVVIALSRRKEE